MPEPNKEQLSDASSAPESGTACDDTSGNRPSDRGCNPCQGAGEKNDNASAKDDPSVAGEER